MEKAITFTTDSQAALFECEIKGQLSDGAWENTHPLNHWECWYEATVLVGEKVGRNFFAIKDNYGLYTQLVKYVGERMLGIARVAKHLGFNHPVFTTEVFNVGHYIGTDGKLDIPTYAGDYADKVRACLGQYKADIEKALADDTYTLKDLKKDLAAVSQAMKTEVR